MHVSPSNVVRWFRSGDCSLNTKRVMSPSGDSRTRRHTPPKSLASRSIVKAPNGPSMNTSWPMTVRLDAPHRDPSLVNVNWSWLNPPGLRDLHPHRGPVLVTVLMSWELVWLKWWRTRLRCDDDGKDLDVDDDGGDGVCGVRMWWWLAWGKRGCNVGRVWGTIARTISLSLFDDGGAPTMMHYRVTTPGVDVFTRARRDEQPVLVLLIGGGGGGGYRGTSASHPRSQSLHTHGQLIRGSRGRTLLSYNHRTLHHCALEPSPNPKNHQHLIGYRLCYSHARRVVLVPVVELVFSCVFGGGAGRNRKHWSRATCITWYKCLMCTRWHAHTRRGGGRAPANGAARFVAFSRLNVSVGGGRQRGILAVAAVCVRRAWLGYSAAAVSSGGGARTFHPHSPTAQYH